MSGICRAFEHCLQWAGSARLALIITIAVTRVKREDLAGVQSPMAG
jgi:hypothetical protein